MSSFRCRLRATFCLFALSCTFAAAQNPTFSLEAAAVNGVEIPGGPTSKLSVSPGATVTLEFYVRDWSPEGEKVRAYQTQLDVDGYTSGLAGAVKPVDFEITTEKQLENSANGFVDLNHPKFIFKGMANLAIADTRSFGYRWLGLLTNETDAFLSGQKGTKYYCGSVNMKVSADAQGTFRLRMLPGDGNTTLRDPLSRAILPVDIEDMFLEVLAGTLAIVSSDPPRWAIDARSSSQGHGGGWDTVSLVFNNDTATLSGSDFIVNDGSTNPPRVVGIKSNGSTIRLKLNRGITPGRWTSIVHGESQTETRIGCLPGDANGDGTVSMKDLINLLESIAHRVDELPRLYDITGDDRIDLADALHVLNVLSKPGAFRNHRLEMGGR